MNSPVALLPRSRASLSLSAVLALVVLAAGMLVFQGCGGDGGGTGPSGETETAAINSATALQEDCFALLEDLFAVMDTASAVDSVVKVFRADSTVAMADTNSQGIYVEYKCGMRGGIILDYRDDPVGPGPSPPGPPDGAGRGGKWLGRARHAGEARGGLTALGSVPADKRTVILNPHYYERDEYTDLIVETYDEYFPVPGFYEPETYFNEECRLEKFTFLESYGIVHLYSHGWAWPSDSYIVTVYMMTGETVNERTSNIYWRDITEGDVPLVIGPHGHKYFISPDFVAKWNNFEADTTLIYGGFCYSMLGGWGGALMDAGAGGYFGFNWSVYTNWNAGWAISLFTEMSDTLRIHPMTTVGWLYGTPYLDKLYYDEEAPEGFVGIYYLGDNDLALYHTRVQVDFALIDEVGIDLMCDIDWDCTSPRSNLSIHKITRPVNIGTRTYESEWAVYRTFTGSVTVYDTGRLYLRFNPAFTRIDSFFVTNSYEYLADAEKLNTYGYPETKTQSYGGHDLPIWVNEPDFSRYIYGVQGRDAADYVDFATCSYVFPDGTLCAIDTYEFTDEVLQMMRFDFHID